MQQSRLRFEFYWKPIKKLRLSASFEFADRGSQEDVIARQQVTRLRATYDISRNYALSAHVQNIKTRNPLNVEGVSIVRNEKCATANAKHERSAVCLSPPPALGAGKK